MPLIVFKMPARFMSEDANDSEKKVFEFYRKKLVGIAEGTEPPFLILPSEIDPESRQPLFQLLIEGE